MKRSHFNCEFRSHWKCWIVLLVLQVSFLGLPLLGQRGSTASIYGTVTDSAGAIIVSANVEAIHLETGQYRKAATDAQGQYQFALLPVGAYQISIEYTGFKTYRATGIVLQVNDSLKVDVQLQLGDVATSVEVEASGAVVNTENATIKDVVDSRRLVDLPLNGRNPAVLTMLVTGVQPYSNPTGDAGLSSYQAPGAMALSVNGSRQNQLKYTLDGGDNRDPLMNANAPFPFPDAVQEFSVVTSTGAAEVGQASAGSVNIVTKSGTNEVHGDIFWFIRNTALNANNFFSRTPDGLKQNQGGLTAGGPILKNKLFLFAGYQRTWIRAISGSSQAATMPERYRSGDFSSLKSAILDPVTRQPFPGNIIPQSRLSPAALALLKYSPVPGPDGLIHFPTSTQQDQSDYVARGDYRPNEKHSVLARFFQQNYTKSSPMQPNNIHSVATGMWVPTTSATLGYTYIARSNLISDTHISVAREVGDRTIPWDKPISTFGVAINSSAPNLDLQMNGASKISMSTANLSKFYPTNIEIAHNWQWVKGKHSLSWGAALMFSRYNEYNTNTVDGRIRFDGSVTGFDQGDYILGYMSDFIQGNGEIEYRRLHYQGFYATDTYRITRRLTLNFGLRWEPYTPVTDLNDREDQFIQPMYLQKVTSPHYVNAPFGIFYPGDKLPNGYVIPKGGTEGAMRDVAPRFGFAWDPTGNGRASIRGGYGIFFDAPELWIYNNMQDCSPFSYSVEFRDGMLDNPYAGRQQYNIFPYVGDFDPKTPFQIPVLVDSLEHQFSPSYTQNWSLTAEWKFSPSWLLRTSYIGSKSTHLMVGYDQNAPIYDFSRTLAQNQSTINQRRPRPQYQGIYTLGTPLGAFYNGLAITLEKRYSRGFTILGSYTLSKNLDYSSTNIDPEQALIDNPFNYGAYRGPADSDHRHRFAGSFVWNLPDPGRGLGSRLISAVFGDWRLGGIVTLQSGSPFSVRSSGNRTAGDVGGPNNAKDSYADLVGNLAVSGSRGRGAQIAQYFNTAAVVQAASGTFGNLGRNVLVGPNFENVDMNIARSFPLRFREAAKLTFRAEFFNLLNRPNLGLPNGTIGNTNFGKITSTTGNPRMLQFSLKAEF